MSARLHAVATAGDQTVPAAMPIVRCLGKYRITGTVGEGAMGVVYRALDPDIDRAVALKTIRRSLLDQPQAGGGPLAAALRFRNEARAAGRLSHPGIVAIYEYGEDADDSFIAMEYVEGTSLLGCTTPRNRLPLADTLSVLGQLLDALSYAHARGVWHRDIKPSNLIVTAGGRLKITDFGIARIDATALTQDALVMGSCGYMAPECYHGVGLDKRVDLFACGVVLYELLTGRRPFEGQPGAVMYRLLHEEPPPLASHAVDAAEAAAFAPYEVIVARAMARDREMRFASAQEMLDALTIVRGQPLPPRLSIDAVQRLRGTAAAPARPHHGDTSALQRALGACRAPAPSSAPRPTAVPSTPRPDTQGSPAFATLPPSPFDAATLAVAEQLLRPALGPLAALVVRRAAARCRSVPALVALLAHEPMAAEERRELLARAQRAFGAPPVPPRDAHAARREPAPPPMALPVLGDTPLADDAVQRAERTLVRQIGPIAKLMVRHARAQCTSREAFIVALADAAADCVERERVLEELQRAV
jgi:serine/threonine-protein kinase